MNISNHLLPKHLISGACLALLLLIGGSTNAQDLGHQNINQYIDGQDNWRINTRAYQTAWLAGITIRPASFQSNSQTQREQHKKVAFIESNENFKIAPKNQPETGWQITAYTDDGIDATERDDSYGLSFTRQW